MSLYGSVISHIIDYLHQQYGVVQVAAAQDLLTGADTLERNEPYQNDDTQNTRDARSDPPPSVLYDNSKSRRKEIAFAFRTAVDGTTVIFEDIPNPSVVLSVVESLESLSINEAALKLVETVPTLFPKFEHYSADTVVDDTVGCILGALEYIRKEDPPQEDLSFTAKLIRSIKKANEEPAVWGVLLDDVEQASSTFVHALFWVGLSFLEKAAAFGITKNSTILARMKKLMPACAELSSSKNSELDLRVARKFTIRGDEEKLAKYKSSPKWSFPVFLSNLHKSITIKPEGVVNVLECGVEHSAKADVKTLRGSDVSFVHTVEGGTLREIASRVVVLSGCACMRIEIVAAVHLKIASTAHILAEAAAFGFRRLLFMCLEQESQEPVEVFPLCCFGLSDGKEDFSTPKDILTDTAKTREIVDKLYTQCRLGDSWKSVGRSVFAVLCCHLPINAALQAMMQRWLIDWVPLLQGTINEPAREKLVELCTFLVTKLAVRAPSSNTVTSSDLFTHLRSLLTANIDIEKLHALLLHREETAQRLCEALDMLATLIDYSTALSNCHVLLLAESLQKWVCSTPHYAHSVKGCSMRTTQRLRESFWGILQNMLKTSEVQQLRCLFTVFQKLDATDIEALCKFDVHRTLLRWAFDVKGYDELISRSTLDQLTFSCSKASVRIVHSPDGVIVDRTSMDWLSLRSVDGWSPKEPHSSTYFEVTVRSKNVRQIVVGLCPREANVRSLDVVRSTEGTYYFDSEMLCNICEGDVIGCGLSTHQQSVFFTLNGVVLFHLHLCNEDKTRQALHPFVVYDASDKTTLCLNFGTAAFAHTVDDEKVEARAAWALWTKVPGTHWKVLHDAALECIELPHTSAASVLLQLDIVLSTLSTMEWDRERLSKKLLDLLSHKCAEVRSTATAGIEMMLREGTLTLEKRALVACLFGALPSNTLPCSRIWYPKWDMTNDENATINGAVAVTNPEAKFAHALGSVLPTSGRASFSIVISHKSAEIRPLMVLGHFYIGVAACTITDLSSASWKNADPPCVWAIHSRRESQLPYANEAALGFDPFLFGNGVVVTVTVDRDAKTVSFSRGSKVFANVFSDVPSQVELRPFVQLVGAGTSGVLIAGESFDGVGEELCAADATMSVLTCALMDADFAPLVVEKLAPRLSQTDNIALRMLTCTGKRRAYWQHCSGQSDATVQWVRGGRALISIGDELFEVPRDKLRIQSQMSGTLPGGSLHGVESASNIVGSALAKWCSKTLPYLTFQTDEDSERDDIQASEATQRQEALTLHCKQIYLLLHQKNSGLMGSVLQATPMQKTYTFNHACVSRGIQIPKHYKAKLALSTSRQDSDYGPFIAVANEPIPDKGLSVFRIRVETDWQALLPFPAETLHAAPPGVYVGVCLSSYRATRRNHALVKTPDMWAVTSIDAKEYHLPHSCSPIKDYPLLFDRETIRVQINREARTLEVFATSFHGGKERAVGTLFNDLPQDVPLFPFVQMSTPLSAAMFLPEHVQLTRETETNLRYGTLFDRRTITCDGCASQLVETSITVPEWYRCNHCADYDLCLSCFKNHLHCGHTFTKMDPKVFFSSPVQHLSCTRGCDVEVGGVCLELVKCEGCLPKEGTHKCAVQTMRGGARAVWGIVKLPIEVSVEFIAPVNTDCHQNYTVAVSPLAAALEPGDAHPQEVVFASQPSIEWSECSFQSGDVLVVVVTGKRVELMKNGTSVRSVVTDWKPIDPLCLTCTSSVVGATMAVGTKEAKCCGKCAEVSTTQKCVRVNDGASSRWVHQSDLLEPLVPPKSYAVLKAGATVYVLRATTKSLCKAVVTKLRTSEEPIQIHDGTTASDVQLSSIFVPVSQNVAEEATSQDLYPDVRKRLRLFYAKWAPEKNEEQIEKAIVVYSRHPKGHAAMFEDLVKKYGPEPEPVIQLPPPARLVRGLPASEIVAAVRLIRALVGLLQVPEASSVVLPHVSSASVALSSFCSKLSLGESELMQKSTLSLEGSAANEKIIPITVVNLSDAQGELPDMQKCLSTKGIPLSTQCHEIDLTAAESSTWQLRMTCSSGFAFGGDLNFVDKVATVYFKRQKLCFAIVDVRSSIATRCIDFGLVAKTDTVELLSQLESFTKHSSTSRREYNISVPSQNNEKACFAVHGMFFVEGGLLRAEGTWRAANGTVGPCALSCVSHALVAGTVYLPPISDCVAPQKEAPNNELVQILIQEVRNLRQLAPCEASSPSHILWDLQMLASKSEVVDALQRIALENKTKFFGVLREALLQMRSSKSTHRQQLCCAVVLGASLDVNVQDVDLVREPLFFEMMHAVVQCAHRHVLSACAIGSVLAFALHCPVGNPICAQLLTPLFAHFCRSEPTAIPPSVLARVVEIYSSVEGVSEVANKLPLKTARFLSDVSKSVRTESPVPNLCDQQGDGHGRSFLLWIPMGAAKLKGEVLCGGQASASLGFTFGGDSSRYYFETKVPPVGRVLIGLVNEMHRQGKALLSCDPHSVGFDGTGWYCDGIFHSYGYAALSPGDVIGCAIDCAAQTVEWSVNGDAFGAVAIPTSLQSATLFPAVQVSSCEGIPLCTAEESLVYLPRGASAVQTDDSQFFASYDSKCRSALPPKSVKFYCAIARKMAGSDVAELQDVPKDTIAAYSNHVRVIERALSRCLSFVDYESSDTLPLLDAIAVLRQIVTKSFRTDVLSRVPVLESRSRNTVGQVTVRWQALFSPEPRAADMALRSCVLGQLYKQLGPASEALTYDPMFVTSLMMTDSGHVPIDAGGPYNQVWSLLSEEIMTEDRAGFHRNPLFRFVHNSGGRWIVPDEKRNSTFDLQMFHFFGSIMGQRACAKQPLALEVSPFVWKFLTEEKITVEDYYTDVEAYWRTYVEDDELLASDEALEYFPKINTYVAQISKSPTHSRLGDAPIRKMAAEMCVLKAMEPQLLALRKGLWSTLGKRCCRSLTHQDLELLICGEATPTFDQLHSSIECRLPPESASCFWEAMRQLTPKDWSAFFYFASAQKRYPLSKKITVVPNNQSTAHLPVAHTCFSSVEMPLYKTVEEMKEKIEKAIQCNVMELA